MGKVLARRFWPLERYPVCFHDLLREGSGVLYKHDLQWTLISTRKRFYEFLRATGDARIWSTEILEGALVVSSRPPRKAELRKVVEESVKTVSGGVDKLA